jgi:hypothetical protein
MNPRLSCYVIRYYRHFMTETEQSAQFHLNSAMKALNGRSDKLAQEEARSHIYWLRFMSADPEVLRMSSNGFESFAEMAAKRILDEHREAISLNCCPRCGELARTPTARQCRVCYFDWHASPTVQSTP